MGVHWARETNKCANHQSGGILFAVNIAIPAQVPCKVPRTAKTWSLCGPRLVTRLADDCLVVTQPDCNENNADQERPDRSRWTHS